MSLGLWEWVLYLVLLTEGIVMIVAALLQRAGIKSFIRPRGFKRLPVGTTILFGAGLALGSITSMIPRSPSTHVLVLCLDWVVICLMLASLAAWLRAKPV
jgi:heme A synthase